MASKVLREPSSNNAASAYFQQMAKRYPTVTNLVSKHPTEVISVLGLGISYFASSWKLFFLTSAFIAYKVYTHLPSNSPSVKKVQDPVSPSQRNTRASSAFTSYSPPKVPSYRVTAGATSPIANKGVPLTTKPNATSQSSSKQYARPTPIRPQSSAQSPKSSSPQDKRLPAVAITSTGQKVPIVAPASERQSVPTGYAKPSGAAVGVVYDDDGLVINVPWSDT